MNERDLPIRRGELSPTYEEISFERNPRTWEVIEEGRQIEKEMYDVQKAEIPEFLRSKPMERRNLAEVLEVRRGEARKEPQSEGRGRGLA